MRGILAALTLLSALFIAPSPAFSGEPQVYFSRHFTLWYYSEHDFMKLESLFREGPMKEISGYGPETGYLGGRLEELYSRTLYSLGVAESGRRFLVVLIERKPAEKDLYNLHGISVTDGAVKYDPATRTLYVYPERAGLKELARELVNAVMDAGHLIPARSSARDLVAVPVADDISAGMKMRGFIR